MQLLPNLAQRASKPRSSKKMRKNDSEQMYYQCYCSDAQSSQVFRYFFHSLVGKCQAKKSFSSANDVR